MSNPMLSVVIPVFNEEQTVSTVIQRLLSKIPFDIEVIAIDDGSTDASGEILNRIAKQDSRIRLISQRNSGKTAALRRGFELSSGEIVIIQDADFEYDPAEIIYVVEPIVWQQSGPTITVYQVMHGSTHVSEAP